MVGKFLISVSRVNKAIIHSQMKCHMTKTGLSLMHILYDVCSKGILFLSSWSDRDNILKSCKVFFLGGGGGKSVELKRLQAAFARHRGSLLMQGNFVQIVRRSAIYFMPILLNIWFSQSYVHIYQLYACIHIKTPYVAKQNFAESYRCLSLWYVSLC